MSAVGRAGDAWFDLTVREREELLSGMHQAMGGVSVWDDVPIEVFANTPDFESLPPDLAGHLLIAHTPTGYSLEEFRRGLVRFCGARP